MTFFHVQNLTAAYGKNEIIRSFTFAVKPNTVTAILGANGSGKTTLLKAICGILPHSGTCTLDGASLEELSPKQLSKICSYIPQRSGISIDISVLDVVLMGFNPQLRMLEYPNHKMKDCAAKALDLVGLSEYRDTNYMTLSEGQKQLCILARTLVADSKLLLLDEPESALDFHFRYKMLTLIRSFVSEGTRSALVTLHDPMLALNYCDHLVLLQNGSILDTLSPREDSLEKMEHALSKIYGTLSLGTCMDKKGNPHIVMMKESE